MTSEKKHRLINRGKRTIEIDGHKFAPNDLTEFEPAQAARLKRLYPDEVQDPEDAVKAFKAEPTAAKPAPKVEPKAEAAAGAKVPTEAEKAEKERIKNYNIALSEAKKNGFNTVEAWEEHKRSEAEKAEAAAGAAKKDENKPPV